MYKYLSAVTLCLVLGLVGGCRENQPIRGDLEDTPENRAKLAERYIELIQFQKMMGEAGEEMASRMPAGSREQFLEYWKLFSTSTNIAEIETVAKRSLSKHMTTSELALFVRFMEDPLGRSAMGKMKYYMADVMPLIQKQVQAALMGFQQKAGGKIRPNN